MRDLHRGRLALIGLFLMFMVSNGAALNDSFEDGTSGWTTGDSVNTQALHGSYSMETDSGGSAVTHIYDFGAEVQRNYASIGIYIPGFSSGDNDRALLKLETEETYEQGSGSWDDYFMAVDVHRFDQDLSLRSNSGQTLTLESGIDTGSWKFIELKNIDFTTESADVYLNGNSVGSISFDASNGGPRYWNLRPSTGGNSFTIYSDLVAYENVQTDSANFYNVTPEDGSKHGVNEDVDMSSTINVDAGGTQHDVELIVNGTIEQVFTHPGDGTNQTYSYTYSQGIEEQDVQYQWNVISSSPDGDPLDQSSINYLDFQDKVIFENFQPPDGSEGSAGTSQDFSVDVTAYTENGIDIEGIYDGSIEQVFSHPGDGTTQSFSYTKSLQSGGNKTYWFNAITSSPGGTSINTTETREFTVNEDVTFSNFTPVDGSTFNVDDTVTMSVDVNATTSDSIDIEAIVDGNIEDVFTHPGDGSVQTFTYNHDFSTLGSHDYWFNAITSSPNGDPKGSTNTRTLTIEGSTDFSLTNPEAGVNVTDGDTVNFQGTAQAPGSEKFDSAELKLEFVESLGDTNTTGRTNDTQVVETISGVNSASFDSNFDFTAGDYELGRWEWYIETDIDGQVETSTSRNLTLEQFDSTSGDGVSGSLVSLFEMFGEWDTVVKANIGEGGKLAIALVISSLFAAMLAVPTESPTIGAIVLVGGLLTFFYLGYVPPALAFIIAVLTFLAASLQIGGGG